MDHPCRLFKGSKGIEKINTYSFLLVRIWEGSKPLKYMVKAKDIFFIHAILFLNAIDMTMVLKGNKSFLKIRAYSGKLYFPFFLVIQSSYKKFLQNVYITFLYYNLFISLHWVFSNNTKRKRKLNNLNFLLKPILQNFKQIFSVSFRCF